MFWGIASELQLLVHGVLCWVEYGGILTIFQISISVFRRKELLKESYGMRRVIGEDGGY